MTTEQLTRVCRAAFENEALLPRDGMTFCNQAVNFIAEQYGYTKYKGLLANQMIDLMRQDHHWQSVGLGEAQAAANRGELAVLGIQEQPHGHVCVVRPGVAVKSGKWQDQAPIVVNIGVANSWDKTANFIFTTKPEAWVLDISKEV